MAYDVGYQMNDSPVAAFEEPKLDKPFAIVITDRVWAAPGVEQSTFRYDFKNPTRSHIEADGRRAGDCAWLDDAAWPLTRELYRLKRDDEVFCPDVCQQKFTYGGVTVYW
jgi:hypothetical protein